MNPFSGLFRKRPVMEPGVRKFRHVRYSLWREHDAEKGVPCWQWKLDDLTEVGPRYHSYEAADWSFGEFLTDEK
jgi:hypothetical protein